MPTSWKRNKKARDKIPGDGLHVRNNRTQHKRQNQFTNILSRMKYTTLISVFIISSCGPGAKLRRAERLIDRAVKDGATWHVDTVYREIEVIVPSIKVDTVLKEVNFSDTITIIKDSVITKVKVDTQTNTVYVSTKCPETRVTERTPVVVHKTIEAKSWLRWWHLIIAFIVGAGVGRFYFALGKV